MIFYKTTEDRWKEVGEDVRHNIVLKRGRWASVGDKEPRVRLGLGEWEGS